MLTIGLDQETVSGMRKALRAIAIVAVLAGGACSSQVDTPNTAADAGTSSTTGLFDEPVATSSIPHPTLPSARAGKGSAPPAGATAPAGSAPAGGTLSAQSDPKMLPAGAVQVASGRNAMVEWRLFAHRSDGKTCLKWEEQTSTGRGGTGGCHYELPIDSSGSKSPRGHFLFGLTSGAAVRVRIEHSDGSAEVFDTSAAAGYQERFWAGEIAPTPLKQAVALDANGRVVGTKDLRASNLAP